MAISHHRNRILIVALLAGFLVGFETGDPSCRWVQAQDAPAKPEPAPDRTALLKLADRIRQIDAEANRRKNVEPLPDARPESQVLATVDSAHLGLLYSGNAPTRWLAFHVVLFNPTDQPITITRDQVSAEIDGENRKLKDLPKQLMNQPIPSASLLVNPTPKRPISVATIKRPKEWKLPAGDQLGMWLIYADLPTGGSVPKCKLKIQLNDVTKEIDVNLVQLVQLHLDVQRIGPRQCLALVTIGGTMNTFNAGSFVEELEKLVEQKMARVVVCWGEGSTPPDSHLMQWLQMAAAGNGGNLNQNPSFPVIPTAIREFHLTEFSGGEDAQPRNNHGLRNHSAFGLRPTPQPRVHKSAAESVGAALRTAYLALPRDELLNEVRTGHPWSRAAALAFGGARLGADQLPQVFEWVEDKDPELQRAALQALSNFGEPQAIEKLIHYAQQNVEPLSTEAIESLAGSRFGAAHDALLAMLKNEPNASKKRIVQVLAKYPRPIWSDALFAFVSNSTNMDPDSLRALVQVGHPRIVEVLEKALNSTDKAISDQAFQELAKRSDPQSETLAVEHALKRLESSQPDATVVQLLSRTKDPRAIPLLMKQLNSGTDRVNAINLLAQMGDQSVADHLVYKYIEFTNHEKVHVLQGLRLFRHPKYRSMCGDAILSNDNQLVMTAANALMQEGHPEGEKLLIAALDKQKTSHVWNNIVNALANFGTPTARAALIKTRDSLGSTRRDDLNRALEMLSQRSPGFQFCYQAQLHRQSKQDKEAMAALNMAIQIDPALPEAYFDRAKLLIQQEKYSIGRKDLEKVLELKHEPRDGEFVEFVTCLSIARIVDGDLADGVNYLEAHRVEGVRKSQARGAKGLFHYNAACAYSRAVEQVDKHPDSPDHDSLREKYRKQAIDDLKESFNQGFDDYDHTAKDPDFKNLHDDPDFKQILANNPHDSANEKKNREE